MKLPQNSILGNSTKNTSDIYVLEYQNELNTTKSKERSLSSLMY